jgi:alkylated DNA repair dioxygenase AlkB
MHKNTFTSPTLSIKNYENIFGEDDKNAWLKILIAELDWLEGEIKLFGKNIKIPRLQSWYADEGCNYKYSGKMLRRNNWHPVLLKIKQNIETVSGEKFNSVLANLYRDGSDSMGWHSDDESSIKQDTSIASVSFGEQRPIFFKHKTDDISFSIDQSHGSLIIMNGETQKFWKHSIKKSKKLMKPRINLTFRTIITS